MWLVLAALAVVAGGVGLYASGGLDALGSAAVDAVAGDDQMDNGGDKAKWAAQMWRALGVALPQLTTEAKLIAFAQAAYESNWGTGYAATNGFNPYNLTTLPNASNGALQANADDEYDSAGTTKRIDQWWMVCSSWSDGATQWWAWLARHSPSAQTAIQGGDAYGFVSDIRAAGYFTLPLATYFAGMSGVLDVAKAMNLG